jgi:hypothetical protein
MKYRHSGYTFLLFHAKLFPDQADIARRQFTTLDCRDTPVQPEPDMRPLAELAVNLRRLPPRTRRGEGGACTGYKVSQHQARKSGLASPRQSRAFVEIFNFAKLTANPGKSAAEAFA